MKRAILMPVLAIATTMAGVNAFADADAQYRAGADFARQVQGQGESSLKNFNPSASIPNYTASPGEKKYYGGVTATGDGAMKADGTTGWTTNEATKAVTDSFVNNPKEPISADAPFIKASQDVQSRADTIIGKTGQTQCEAQNINRSEFTNYTCERDLQIEQICTRAATLGVEGNTAWETKTVDYEMSNLPVQVINGNMVVTVTPQISGEIVEATYSWSNVMGNNRHRFRMIISVLGASIEWHQHDTFNNIPFKPVPSSFTAGKSFTSSHPRKVEGAMTYRKHVQLKLHFVIRVKKDTYKPVVAWSENCPFSKAEGILKRTECTEAGGTRTVIAGGNPLQATETCWAYKDTYATQVADAGNCKTYVDNPACTLASRNCAFSAEDGVGCLHEYATFSCETRTAGKVMVCGGDTFCLDGECERAQKGKNNDFSPVVSALAALAAAGKDAAEINSADVRAFTGEAKFCKKAVAGFSNCCKDSGWGQDVGLASCSTEEKALGKAKEGSLTVSVGEFCAKKVLGVCLEKKRGYCQFDSKLAQIVQQQGRNGQLHIDFGKASSPDCRGITQTELQQINFEALDFSNFFDDLQKNKKIPDNDTLTKRVREEIAAQLKNKQ